MFRHVSFAAAHSCTVPIRTPFHFSFSPSRCRRRPVLKFLTNANSLYKQQSGKHGEKHLSRKSANSDAVIESDFSRQAQAGAPLQPSDWLTPDRQYLLRPNDYVSLYPCWRHPTLPRVEHLIPAQSGPLIDFIASTLELHPQYVMDLIDFGAVFYAPIAPPPPPHASPDLLLAYNERINKIVSSPLDTSSYPLPPRKEKRKERLSNSNPTSQILTSKKGRGGGGAGQGGDGGAGKRKGDGGVGEVVALSQQQIRELQRPKRVEGGDGWVVAGGFVRVHVHPRRFPRCYDIQWEGRIISEGAEFVVVNKPAGISVGGSIDNRIETCAAFAGAAIGSTAPLRITHQLDNCTEGCVVFAKTKAFASYFNTLLQDRRVSKLYRALTVAPVREGSVVHYMRGDKYPPRVVVEDEREGWFRCELQVISCRKVPWPSLRSAREGGVCDMGGGGKEPQEFAYECKIRLMTGRTHQIRAQLAAIGAPLVADTMYLPNIIPRRPWTPLEDEGNVVWDTNVAINKSTLQSSRCSEGQSVDAQRRTNGSFPTATNVYIPKKSMTEKSDIDGLSVETSQSDPDCSSTQPIPDFDFVPPKLFRGEEGRLYGPEPEGAIGLQAWQIRWEGEGRGGEKMYQAGQPWWRDSDF